MATMQDSSVLFSLKNLMSLGEARAREEQEAARRRAEAEQRAREEEAQQKAAVLAAQAEAAQRERERREAAAREEQARLEGIRLAALEKARIEAAQAAQMAMMRAAAEHASALAAIQRDATKQRLRRALLGGAAGVILLGGAAAFGLGKLHADTETTLTTQQGLIAATGEDNEKLRQRLAENDRRLREATETLEETQRRLQASAAAKPGDVAKATASHVVKTRSTTGTAGTTGTQARCDPNAGDPSCDINGNRVF